MDHIACTQCLDAAQRCLQAGQRETGLAYYLAAEVSLQRVADPIQYLMLTLRADVLVRRHLLPEWNT